MYVACAVYMKRLMLVYAGSIVSVHPNARTFHLLQLKITKHIPVKLGPTTKGILQFTGL